MNKIKDQIDALIVFTATDFETLKEEKSHIIERCAEGIERMKEAKVFTDKEISEINLYCDSVINARHNSVRHDLANTIRTNFKF